MSNVGYNTFFPSQVNTVFKVINISANRKKVQVFNYPIHYNNVRDLMKIPFVSEADIRHSLLKGDLNIKIRGNELRIVESNIDLLQFDPEQRNFLIQAGASTVGIDHEALRDLIHFIDDGPVDFGYHETVGSPFPTYCAWYTDSTKTKLIVDLSVIRDGEQNAIQETWRMYDLDGVTIISTVTDTIAYNGPFEVNRTRVAS